MKNFESCSNLKKTYFGRGKSLFLERLLNQLDAKSIMIVTSKKSYEDIFKAKVEASIQNRQYVFFSDFSANPKFEDLLRGLTYLRDNACDVVVAIGGGSVLDMAKLIALLATNPDAVTRNGVISHQIVSAPLPLILLPTTAGTGSEATHFAVMYKDGVKQSVASQLMRPKSVIIDPDLYKMPPKLAACSGLDALCQSIESIWAVGATKQSLRYATFALKLIQQNFVKSLKGDSLALANMCMGAFFSGKAIDISKTTAPHALSYHLTTHYQIPHGHAVALNCQYFFELNAPVKDKPLQKGMSLSELKHRFDILLDTIGVSSTSQAKNWMKDIMKTADLEDSLEKILTKPSAIRDLVNDVNKERLKNNPIDLSCDDLEAYYLQHLLGLKVNH